MKVKYRKYQFLPSGSSPGSLWLLSLHQGWISLPKRGLKLPKSCLWIAVVVDDVTWAGALCCKVWTLVLPGSISAALRSRRAQALWEHRMRVAGVLDLPHSRWHFCWRSSTGTENQSWWWSTCFYMSVDGLMSTVCLWAGAGVSRGIGGHFDQREKRDQTVAWTLHCPSWQGRDM